MFLNTGCYFKLSPPLKVRSTNKLIQDLGFPCLKILGAMVKNIVRVRNCPDVNIKLSFCSLSFCVFVFLYLRLFVFLSGHHGDLIFEGSQGSKLTIYAELVSPKILSPIWAESDAIKA